MKSVQKRNKIIILTVLMLIFSLSTLFSDFISTVFKNFLVSQFSIIESNDRLMVHFISVGQGDAIAINLPNEEVMLIDAGPNDNSVTLTNYIKQKVLNNSHDNKIDYLILTHADSDHIGGALRVLKEFEVENIFIPFLESETDSYVELTTFIENGDYNILPNLQNLFEINHLSMEVYGPYESADTNDSCPIIRLEYLETSFLFTGDISTDIEEKLLTNYNDDIDCDIIKIAHHGSKYSSSLEFLQAVSPEYAVISCGKNSYGHPTDTVINNIIETGASVLRTDLQGNILFSVEEQNSYDVLTGDYIITGLILDYRFFVLIIDIILLVCICVLIFKKEKHN